jgi:hypothetical protein
LSVFYSGDQNTVIVEAIAPTLRRLRTSGWIARYFFVRYWNGGPHLRIRMECLRPVAEVEREFRQDIQPGLQGASLDAAEIGRYNAESAQLHSLEARLAGAEARVVEPLEPLQPSGTIQTRPYRFDEERYGGPWAAEDTHDHAWASTEIACAVLESTMKNPASRQVFALHAAAVVPAVLEVADAAAFEYFIRCSELETDRGSHRGERRWENHGFLPYESQRAALDDVRALTDRRAPSVPEFWLLLLEAWRTELERRREFLVQTRAVHGLRLHPDHLILDAMHLFRIGWGSV